MTSEAQIYTAAFSNFLSTWLAVKNRQRPFTVTDVLNETDMTRSKVYRNLIKLTAMGLLEREQYGGRTVNVFKVIR